MRLVRELSGAGSGALADFDPRVTKIVHLAANPTAVARRAKEGEWAERVAALTAENAVLGAELERVSTLLSASSSSSSSSSSSASGTLNTAAASDSAAAASSSAMDIASSSASSVSAASAAASTSAATRALSDLVASLQTDNRQLRADLAAAAEQCATLQRQASEHSGPGMCVCVCGGIYVCSVCDVWLLSDLHVELQYSM
jgi:hypothetical protein